MARHHFVVLINQTDWRVVHMRGQVFLAVRTFGVDAGSRTALLGWWQQFPQAKVSFLTNHADEHYHVEVLPQVRGAAARQLLMRKLATWPFSPHMHTACLLDHVHTLRREMRFLFVACAYPPLADWLPLLQKQAIRIQGVYTQALGLACWLPACQPDLIHRLCIQCTQQQVRISYLQQQRLLFSRLILLPADVFSTHEACMGRIVHELSQIRLMLEHQGWLPKADILQLVWLGQMPTDIQWLQKQLPAACVWSGLTESELVRHLGLQALPEALDAMDWAAVQVVLKGHALPNLVPESVLLPDSILRIKRRLHWAGGVMASLMLLAGWLGIQATHHAYGQVQQIQHQLSVRQLATQTISQEQLPSLRTLVQAMHGLQSSVRLPGRALTIMQQALMGVAHWQVATMTWDFAGAGALSGKLMSQQEGAATAWQETLVITWTQGDQSQSTVMAWPQLLHRLRGLPEVEKVEVLMSTESTGDAQRHGSTGSAIAAGQPTAIKLYLRDAKQGAI